MENRLAKETSPYLLQHRHNPVDWYPWGDEAIQRARTEDKPIFLSIGYAACHWCHVMENESFEDPDTAAIMNQYFINIKVDREERPDIDTIYMNAVVAMTGQGGWPMSVFLSPELKPFYGGTYYPPERRFNLPSFRDVLMGVANAWQNEREKVAASAEELTQHLSIELAAPLKTSTLDPKLLDNAAFTLAQNYDWVHGGWGQAPKFPQPMALHFLMKRIARGDRMAQDLVNHALATMARGGMYDLVGGGFHRYSVDNLWLVPHFEKMLYDNAQLALVYLYGFLISGNTSFRKVCERTIEFVQRELTHDSGGFYSSLDADSEGVEGIFYIWDPAEVQTLVEDEVTRKLFQSAFEISAEGNFEGGNILQFKKDLDNLAASISLPPQEVESRLDQGLESLLAARNERVRPGTDDKVLTSWNGLMLLAASEAGRYLGREDFTQMAMRNGQFLVDNLFQGDTLYRSWRNGVAKGPAFLEDYGALILGLLSLYQTDPDPKWFGYARDLTESMVTNFWVPHEGFYDTRPDQAHMLIRPRDLQDNATPSGGSLATSALLQMAAYEGQGDWRSMAETSLGTIQTMASQYPTAFSQWLCALDFAQGPVFEVAILGPEPDRDPLTKVLWSQYRPTALAAISQIPADPESPRLLADRALIDQKSTAYVCQDHQCNLPLTEPEELASQLKEG